MNHRKIVLIIIILSFLTFFAIQNNIKAIILSSNNIWQAWVLFGMFASVLVAMYYAQNQINAQKRVENNRRLGSIFSLITELKYNKDLLYWYIQHAVRGNNVASKTLGGRITFELNEPLAISYERDLIPACQDDPSLVNEITDIYSKLGACKTLVGMIQNFVASNEIECKRKNDVVLLDEEKSKYNKQLSDISKKLINRVYKVIKKLELVKNQIEEQRLEF